MLERMTIADADLRLILDVVDRARAGERGAYVPHSALRDLTALVPFDDATFQVMDLRAATVSLQSVDDPEAFNDEDLDLWWPAFWEHCAYPQHSSDYVSVIRASDDLPHSSRGPHWARYLEANPGFPEYHVIVSLPPVGTVDRRLILWRDAGPDFSDREVRLLALLRPHLAELHELHRQAGTPLPELTVRQWQILALVGDGDTNGQIARQLGVSEGTVRKHLENAYARLGVTNRIAAVRAAREFRRAG